MKMKGVSDWGGSKGGDWGGVKGWGRGALCLPFCLQYIYQEGSRKNGEKWVGDWDRRGEDSGTSFANDIVLCGGSEIELSHLLGITWQELDKLGLEINEVKSMVLPPVGGPGEVREQREVISSEEVSGVLLRVGVGVGGGWQGGGWVGWGGGVRQMVITEGEDYKYLGVMVSNLGVVCGHQGWQWEGRQ